MSQVPSPRSLQSINRLASNSESHCCHNQRRLICNFPREKNDSEVRLVAQIYAVIYSTVVTMKQAPHK